MAKKIKIQFPNHERPVGYIEENAYGWRFCATEYGNSKGYHHDWTYQTSAEEIMRAHNWLHLLPPRGF